MWHERAGSMMLFEGMPSDYQVRKFPRRGGDGDWLRGIRSPTWSFRRARIRADALEDPAPEDNPVGSPPTVHLCGSYTQSLFASVPGGNKKACRCGGLCRELYLVRARCGGSRGAPDNLSRSWPRIAGPLSCFSRRPCPVLFYRSSPAR